VSQEIGFVWDDPPGTTASSLVSVDQQLVQQHAGAALAVKLKAGQYLAAPVLPSWVVFVDKLPLSANGKVVRGELPDCPFDTVKGTGR
jgi:acyl-coenzyme A synthetase/AMP-(fatty) acid ligase